MMPGEPGTLDDGGPDYDDPAWDPFWAAAVDLGLPSASTYWWRSSAWTANRGSRLNGFLGIIRGIQDIMGTLVFGSVFERHPKLNVVCVEADAEGWVRYITEWARIQPSPQLDGDQLQDHHRCLHNLGWSRTTDHVSGRPTTWNRR